MLPARGEAVYFLVGGLDIASPSYVLPLTKLEDIQEAVHQLYEVAPVERLLPGVRIVAGSDGLNRDLHAPGKPQWHWHVAEFIKFAEGAVPEITVAPRFVEMDVEGYIRVTHGSYAYGRIVAMLTPEEVFWVSASVVPGGVQLSWLDLGAGYAYTVETAAPSCPCNWYPVPGTAWPITATVWMDTSPPATGARLYRVRAQQTPQGSEK